METRPYHEKILKELETLKQRVSSNNEIINRKLNYNTEKFSLIEEKLNLLLSRRNLSTPGSLEAELDNLSFNIKAILNTATVKLENNLIISRLFNGQRMIVDANDLSVAPCIIFDGCWEMWITEVFLKLLRADYTFFDLGANFGYYTVLAAPRLSRGKIYSFEANPDLIDILNKNIILNQSKDRGIAENYAVWDKSGKVDFHIFDQIKANSSIHKEDKPDRVCNLKSISIDDYCKINHIQQIDLMKIDVEGAEDRVYKGMKNVIRNNDDLKVLMEFTPKKYDNPGSFYQKMNVDFPYIYFIKYPPDQKKIHRVKSMEELKTKSNSDWQMLLLSKKEVNI